MYRKSLIRLGAIRRATFPKGKAYCIRNHTDKSKFEIQSNILMRRSAFDLRSHHKLLRVLPAGCAGSALPRVLPALRLPAEVCFLHHFAGGKLCAGSRKDDPSVFKDVRSVGDGEGFTRVLLNE